MLQLETSGHLRIQLWRSNTITKDIRAVWVHCISRLFRLINMYNKINEKNDYFGISQGPV